MTKLSSLKTKLSAFTADESGATIIEYALLASLIGVALIFSVKALTTKVGSTLANVGGAL
jgi:Flp pilus assembly pilin Flp